MSAMMVESRTAEYAAEQTYTHSHPRGRGFQVLSRIARVRTEDGEGRETSGVIDYAPRHRRDVAPERTLRALAI